MSISMKSRLCLSLVFLWFKLSGLGKDQNLEPQRTRGEFTEETDQDLRGFALWNSVFSVVSALCFSPNS